MENISGVPRLRTQRATANTETVMQLSTSMWQFPPCKQPQQLYFYGLPKLNEKVTTQRGYTHRCLHTSAYLYMCLCLCAPICLHPNGAEDNRDTCVISPRSTRIVAATPKHIRDDDNNGATHREAAEMRHLLGPDTEANPRVTTVRLL